MLYHLQPRLPLPRLTSLLLNISTFMQCLPTIGRAIAARLQHQHDKQWGLVVRPDMSMVPYQLQRMSASLLFALETLFHVGQLLMSAAGPAVTAEASYELARDNIDPNRFSFESKLPPRDREVVLLYDALNTNDQADPSSFILAFLVNTLEKIREGMLMRAEQNIIMKIDRFVNPDQGIGLLAIQAPNPFADQALNQDNHENEGGGYTSQGY